MEGTKPAHSYSGRNPQKGLWEFAADLKTATERALPSTDKSYAQVAVIAFHWENDGMVKPLERELLDVFRLMYGFYVESYTIPGANCQAEIATKLLNWSMKWARPDTLRIYVYSGHAGEVANNWYLAGRADGNGNLIGPRVNWLGIHVNLESLEGDMCYIFDCPAGAITMNQDGAEILAATGREKGAGMSFTRTLIDTLKSLNGQSETLAGIFSIMFRNARQNHVESLPAHIAKAGQPSITLSGMHGLEGQQIQSYGHRVLLSIHLQDAIQKPDLEQWKAWLAQNIPSGILSADVTMDSLFEGCVALVTVPVEIWTMLPADDRAYNFVAHVRSSNILPQLTGL